ncbi:MAG: hypothetical protein WA123_06070 [Methylotenera sp.]
MSKSMNNFTNSIPKNPALSIAEDFYKLRSEGIGFIEQMSSQLWTDYNTHDPGITILEALCYALTDLAYRTNYDIKDLLANQADSADTPYSKQAFYTAKEILTNNALTLDDYRRLLIDLDGVRNAWVFCKPCACDFNYYAWCDKGGSAEDGQPALQLSYQPPLDPTITPKKVEPKGLYEVFLELESDSELGDLNDRKIEYRYHDVSNPDLNVFSIELRFPEPELMQFAQWQKLLAIDTESISAITLKLGAIKNFDLYTDAGYPTDNERDEYLQKFWNNVWYASFTITLTTGTVNIQSVAVRFLGGNTIRNQITAKQIKDFLIDTSANGLISRYRRKLVKTRLAIDEAKTSLQNYRNLEEDYCRICIVGVEDVAVCADIAVAPDADIERVQAKIWFEIEQYFNPPVPFYSLQELLDAGVAVEEIFNGPQLNNGFIKRDDLVNAGLKKQLRVSDIVNRLMDIPGVVAVNNLLLSKYDAEGNQVKGAADPDLDGIFNANKASAEWLLMISNNHQPRFYRSMSRFLFYKNTLPFLPRKDEVYDTYIQIKGEAERPRLKFSVMDLLAPIGEYRDLETYSPVQYSFPLTYGIGLDGLPSHVSEARRAQAKQLKAYLMVFEQLLGNAFAQVAHAANLFSLDPDEKRTYFERQFSETVIHGYDEITQGVDLPTLQGLCESSSEYHDRRNRFLNHLLARFGEQFSEYALLLNNTMGRSVAQDKLIDDKISFLNAYPKISHDRARAFNYKLSVGISDATATDNISGIKQRISLLLGYPSLSFDWVEVKHITGKYRVTYHLKDRHGKVWLEGKLKFNVANAQMAINLAYQTLMRRMIQPDAYKTTKTNGVYTLKLKDAANHKIGHSSVNYKTIDEVLTLAKELWGWSSNQRAIVVEHLLLRPKFIGDALYPACNEGACGTCGDEDPYSFKLTFVMPGWTEPYNVNLDLRGFADRTIRQETPAHLLGKICWVGNDGFVKDPCSQFISNLSDLLITEAHLTSLEACTKANSIDDDLTENFAIWYEPIKLNYIQSEALSAQLKVNFSAIINTLKADYGVDVSTKIEQMAIVHFHDIALYGWQFERFETAWELWLAANAQIDWADEHLQAKVETILENNMLTKPSTTANTLCDCARGILTKYGMDFYRWMEANVKAGTLRNFTTFVPSAIVLCTGYTFQAGTETLIKTLLDDSYKKYQEVSYRLWAVVSLLSKMRNTYPGATLHDCDDGSDINPVRLGSTTLGSQPLKAVLLTSTDLLG